MKASMMVAYNVRVGDKNEERIIENVVGMEDLTTKNGTPYYLLTIKDEGYAIIILAMQFVRATVI